MPRPQKYVTRSSLGWGRTTATPANPTQGLAIHYDSKDQRLFAKPHSACIDYWNWCRSFHINTRKWRDVGYSWFCCSHGYVIEGRGLFREQAAQPGGNTTYYSATLATGPTDEITPAQIEAVRQLRQWLMEPESSIAGTVKGHRDFIPTSCPGDKAYALVKNGTFAQPPGSISIGDDVPDHRYLSTKDTTTLRRDEWTQIKLGDPDEWSLAGLSKSRERFTAETGWRIEGLNEDDEYQVRLAVYDPPTGGGSWRFSHGRRISEHRHHAGDAWDTRTFVGQVSADQRVRVEIKQWTSDDARVVSTNSDIFTWKV